MIIVAILSAVLIAGCGQSAADKKAADDKRVAAAAAKAAQEKKEKEIGETGALCGKLVSDFTASLADLNSRLSVGLKPDEYNSKVGDARVAYDSTNWDDTPNQYCLMKVGVPLEGAFNEFQLDASS